MPKRQREDEAEEAFTPSKRPRSFYSIDRISTLSDELVLRILSFLPVDTLLICQRISHRFNSLSSDSELWKERYYARFVLPRALRIPGIKDATSSHTHYASKLSRWLEDDHLVRRGRSTNWKAQYRLRHNWSKGKCRLKELEVAQPPLPPALVKYHHGLVVTLNTQHDLRVWRMKDGAFLGEVRPAGEHSNPTSLAVDAGSTTADSLTLAVGYEDGSFRIFEMQIASRNFARLYAHPSSSNGAISSIASTFPFVLTLSRNRTVSLYRFDDKDELPTATTKLSDPQLISSLVASQVYQPVTVSIRISSLNIIACIAYSYSRLRLGWNIGLQELLLDREGTEVSSRIAWTPDWLERSASTIYDIRESEIANRGVEGSQEAYVRTRPTSLSYSHPYLLASYPDNTLKVYQVSSTADTLAVQSGRRLWGHTSGISRAEVNDRGKAVSVSLKGNDIRIWELEEGLGKAASSGVQQRSSVRVQMSSEEARRSSGGSFGLPHKFSSRKRHIRDSSSADLVEADSKYWGDIPITSNDMNPLHAPPTSIGYVAFDDEQVIVLNQREAGEQYISCYDFT